MFIIADEELVSRRTCTLGHRLNECVWVCVSAGQVGDRRETLNDSHVRQLLYETSDLINRSEEDARRQPEGHRSSLRSAVRRRVRACVRARKHCEHPE